MNKEEIIKEYVNYCIDLKINNISNEKNKNKYIRDYMKNWLYYNANIQDFEEARKEIENILKYNNLSILKNYNNIIKNCLQFKY